MKLNPKDFQALKGQQQIAMLTAYNCPIARYIEQIEVPVILVGDTLAMVEMGYESTRSVTIENMAYHIGAVRRGAPQTHIIGDMPYQTYDTPEDAWRNARILLEAGADSVKLEGPMIEAIAYLREHDIAVVGHTGLTPQTASNFKQVGHAPEDAKRVQGEAQALAAAGVFMIVLEHIPESLGAEITSSVAVPTIGIGAGMQCDGQVLVTNDALGIGDYWPPFSKQYVYLGKIITEALSQFKKEVEGQTFDPRAK